MRKTHAFRPAAQFEVTLGSASEAFRLRCQAQNLSTGTLAWYKQILKMFERFLETQGVTTARAVTPTLLRQHLEDMRGRGNSTVTVARTYGGLRCFFGFMARERMIPQNPCQLVEKPRMERKLIRPLSLDQVRLLLAQCNQKRYDEHRLWTIMVLIFDTGLRISEVIGLRKDAIDFQGGVMRVMGKGGKERQVPFGVNSKRALWGYMARRGDVPGQDLFFVSRFGGRCCRYLLRKEFHRLGQQAGIQGVRVSPQNRLGMVVAGALQLKDSAADVGEYAWRALDEVHRKLAEARLDRHEVVGPRPRTHAAMEHLSKRTPPWLRAWHALGSVDIESLNRHLPR